MSEWNRTNYQMVLRNQSTLVTDAQVVAMMDAIQKQIDNDVYHAWGLKAELVMMQKSSKAIPPLGSMLVNIRDVSDEAGALGHHWNEHNGLPVTYVFAQDDMADGAGIDGLSVTLSHEVIEMLVDPGANLLAQGPIPNRKNVQALYPYEACDAVQGGRYQIDGVAVSDFVFPEWFEAKRVRGERFNQLATLKAPFTLDTNGYASVMRLTGGTWQDIWGPQRTVAPGRHRHIARQRAVDDHYRAINGHDRPAQDAGGPL